MNISATLPTYVEIFVSDLRMNDSLPFRRHMFIDKSIQRTRTTGTGSSGTTMPLIFRVNKSYLEDFQNWIDMVSGGEFLIPMKYWLPGEETTFVTARISSDRYIVRKSGIDTYNLTVEVDFLD